MLKKVVFLAIIPVFMGIMGISIVLNIAEASADVILEGKNLPFLSSSAGYQCHPVSGGEEREDLQDQMQEVFEELRKLEEMFKQKMDQDVLPRIREEIKRLKEWLEEHEGKKGEPPPQWTRRTPTTHGKAYDCC